MLCTISTEQIALLVIHLFDNEKKKLHRRLFLADGIGTRTKKYCKFKVCVCAHMV